MGNNMRKQTKKLTTAENIRCIILMLLLLISMMYPFLQYRQAIMCINTGNVQHTESPCVDVKRESRSGSRGSSTYFYRLYLEDGMVLSTIIGGNVDITLQAYETMKTAFTNAKCFNYVTISVFGIEKHWLISAQAEDEVIVSEDGLLQKLETRKRTLLFGTWLCGILAVPMILVSAISISGVSLRKLRLLSFLKKGKVYTKNKRKK